MTSAASECSVIERELYIDASPATVFEVISQPKHIVGWWSDEAELDQAPGGRGFIAFGDVAACGKRVELTIDEAIPPRLFAFRWAYAAGEQAVPGNSNLVTFELVPEGTGTRVCFRETGFTERGWDDAQARAHYADHSNGWDHFLARLAAYAPGVER